MSRLLRLTFLSERRTTSQICFVIFFFKKSPLETFIIIYLIECLKLKKLKLPLKNGGLLSEKFDSDTKKILKPIFAAINKMNKNQLQEISILVGMFNWPLTKLNSLSWKTRASWSVIWKKPLAYRASTWSTGKTSFKSQYNTIFRWWNLMIRAMNKKVTLRLMKGFGWKSPTV